MLSVLYRMRALSRGTRTVGIALAPGEGWTVRVDDDSYEDDTHDGALSRAEAAHPPDTEEARWTTVAGRRWTTDGAACVSEGWPRPEIAVDWPWFAPSPSLAAALEAGYDDGPTGPFAHRMAPVLEHGALKRSLVGDRCGAVLDADGNVRALLAPLTEEEA